MFCAKCRHQNPDGSNFCSRCGCPAEQALSHPGVNPRPAEPNATELIQRAKTLYRQRHFEASEQGFRQAIEIGKGPKSSSVSTGSG
jgi:hypothetical protein